MFYYTFAKLEVYFFTSSIIEPIDNLKNKKCFQYSDFIFLCFVTFFPVNYSINF